MRVQRVGGLREAPGQLRRGSLTRDRRLARRSGGMWNMWKREPDLAPGGGPVDARAGCDLYPAQSTRMLEKRGLRLKQSLRFACGRSHLSAFKVQCNPCSRRTQQERPRRTAPNRAAARLLALIAQERAVEARQPDLSDQMPGHHRGHRLGSSQPLAYLGKAHMVVRKGFTGVPRERGDRNVTIHRKAGVPPGRAPEAGSAPGETPRPPERRGGEAQR